MVQAHGSSRRFRRGAGCRGHHLLSFDILLVAQGADYSLGDRGIRRRRLRSDLMFLALSKPWLFWVAAVLVAACVMGIISIAIGYYVKVLSNKSHRR
jgi:hypothetical protein